jgi:hypothetical protein
MADTKIISRFAEPIIREQLANNKILIITGPRQAGKTTLLNHISEELKASGEQVYFYNFDRVADLDFFKNQQKVEAFLKIRSLKQRMYVFIDEVQRKKDAGNFFKYFYDEGLNVKFVFSGSSSVELTDSFGDALTGRKRMFTLLPLSLLEIARHELEEEWSYARLGEPLALEKLKEIVNRQLIWGSYPEVQVQRGEKAKLNTLGELYESYVQKDVKDLLRVKNISGFNLLVKVLAHNIGNPIVVEDLVRQTGLHTATVNSYLDILEGTMIISRTDNYNPDFSDKLPKSQRYYFVDNGMRNFSLGMMSDEYRGDMQQLAANLIYSELMKHSQADIAEAEDSSAEVDSAVATEMIPVQNSDIFHYQTYSDNHIDFIIAPKMGSDVLPVFVQYPEDNEKLGKKIHEFINSHEPKKMIVVTDELAEDIEVKGCQVKFIPLHEFLAKLN